MELFATPNFGFPFVQMDVGGYKNYHYVVACPRTKKGVIVDPAFALPEVFETAAKQGIRIEQAIFTHAHWDHIGGLPDVLKMGVRKAVVHEAAAHHKEVQAAMPRVHLIQDGDEWRVGDVHFRAIHTPGHQPESTCYAFGVDEEVGLFTGDTLFIDACGRTDFPGGNTDDMFASMAQLRQEDGKLWVFCGHNYHVKPYDLLENQWQSNEAFTTDRARFDALPFLRD